MSDGNPAIEVLTVAEVATYLRVSETTVWRWCSTGKLPGFRIGRGWRIRRSDLYEYINRSFSEIVEHNANQEESRFQDL